MYTSQINGDDVSSLVNSCAKLPLFSNPVTCYRNFVYVRILYYQRLRGHLQTIFGKINVIVTLTFGPPPLNVTKKAIPKACTSNFYYF